MWRLPPLSVDWATLALGQLNPGGDVPAWVLAAGSAVGGILVTILSGKLVVPTFAYTREREKADYWQGEFMALSRQMTTQVVSALSESTRAMGESQEATKQAIAVFGRRER